MKDFVVGLITYGAVIFLSWCFVFPLFPSDLPVLLLLLITLMVVGRRMARPPEAEDSSGSAIKAVVFDALILAVSLTVLILDSSPMGPMLVAAGLLLILSFCVSRKRLSILAGALIFTLVLMGVYMLYNGLFYEDELVLSLLPEFLVISSLVHAFSKAGMEAGEKRPLSRSVFPKLGKSRKGEAFAGVLTGSVTVCVIISMIKIVAAIDERQDMLHRIDDRKEELKELREMVQDVESGADSWLSEWKTLEAGVDTRNASEWVEDMCDPGFSKCDHFISEDGRDSSLSLAVEGEWSSIWQLISDNRKAPYGGRLVYIDIHTLEEEGVGARIRWTYPNRIHDHLGALSDKIQSISFPDKETIDAELNKPYRARFTSSSEALLKTDLSSTDEQEKWSRSYFRFRESLFKDSLRSFANVRYKIKLNDRFEHLLERQRRFKEDQLSKSWHPDLLPLVRTGLEDVIEKQQSKGNRFNSFYTGDSLNMARITFYSPYRKTPLAFTERFEVGQEEETKPKSRSLGPPGGSFSEVRKEEGKPKGQAPEKMEIQTGEQDSASPFSNPASEGQKETAAPSETERQAVNKEKEDENNSGPAKGKKIKAEEVEPKKIKISIEPPGITGLTLIVRVVPEPKVIMSEVKDKVPSVSLPLESLGGKEDGVREWRITEAADMDF